MDNKKKILIILVLFALFSFGFVFAQRNLEVDYPGLFGSAPSLGEKDILPKYVSYIFNFAVAISGLIALGALIYAGFRYLTSSGDPSKMQDAKEQIISAFWGLLIILASFLILQNINPQLTLMEIKKEDLGQMPAPEDSPPAAPPAYPNYLWRISEIADTTKLIINQEKGLIKSAGRLHSLTSRCNCSLTNPLCLCRSYMGGGCQAVYCYAGSKNQPCPDEEGIKEEQQNVIASFSELLYYRKRAVTEREDFLLHIEDLEKKIEFYQERISVEKSDYVKGELEKSLERDLEQRELYLDLKAKLQELSDLITGASLAADKLSKLPDGTEGIPGCLENVRNQCQGSCAGGCHDTLECSPISCSGGNPCPMAQIIQEKQTVNSFGNRITEVCDQILTILEKTETVLVK